MLQESKYSVLTEKGLISKDNYKILINYISKNLGNRQGNEFEVNLIKRVLIGPTITCFLTALSTSNSLLVD